LSAQKIAVIGWDAATFDVVTPLLQAGTLPNLKRLMSQGAWGHLESTLHPISPTAWASFMTGMNPGKHGVFDFIGMDQNRRFRILNGAAVKGKTLWARLSEANRRVAVVNVPMTYPPEPVNGALIAGMDAPRSDRAYTHPPELEAELCEHFGGYQEGVRTRSRIRTSVERFTAQYVEQLQEVTQLHGRVACHLLEHYPVDFLMVVFTAPDRVQHALGHLMAGTVSPDDGIGQVYQACDDALGQILERLDDGWTILVMSDHGACAYRRVFELSTWLEERGWLRLRSVSPATRAKTSLNPVWRRLSRLMGRPAPGRSRVEQFVDRIIWEETRAFAMGAFGSIYLNACGRFPEGIVKGGTEYDRICRQITSELLSTRDAKTGAPVVKAVHRSAEVYSGPYVPLAPDLLVETTADYFVRNNLDQDEDRVTYPAGRYRGRSLAHTGRHTRNGILVASGGPFASKQNLDGAHIMDLAPTILHLSGLSVPTTLDGEPLLEWLNPEYYRRHPVRWRDSPATGTVGDRGPSYDEQDEAAVESRLRDLGYLT